MQQAHTARFVVLQRLNSRRSGSSGVWPLTLWFSDLPRAPPPPGRQQLAVRIVNVVRRRSCAADTVHGKMLPILRIVLEVGTYALRGESEGRGPCASAGARPSALWAVW